MLDIVRNPNLSILIPTLGRDDLSSTLKQLEFLLNEFKSINCEVILASNGPNSDEKVLRIVNEFDLPNLNVITNLPYVESAEESAMRSVEFCKGDYIWTLGDDDVILAKGFEYLLQIIKRGESGCFFAVKQMTSHGRELQGAPFITYKDEKSYLFSDLLSRTGIPMGLTGFGRLVLRREYFNFSNWQNIAKTNGYIFSNVVSFAQTVPVPIIVSSVPILKYRQSSYHEGSLDNWKKSGKVFEYPALHPFVSGHVNHILYLLDTNTWTMHQARYSLMAEREMIYYTCDYILNTLIEQLLSGISDENQLPSEQDWLSLDRYFYSIAHTTLPVYLNIRKIFFSTDKRAFEEELRNCQLSQNQYATNDFFTSGIVGWNFGFPIYGHPGGYFFSQLNGSTQHLGFRTLDIESLPKSAINFSKSLEDLRIVNVSEASIFTQIENVASTRYWGHITSDFISVPKIYSGIVNFAISLVRKTPKWIRSIYLKTHK